MKCHNIFHVALLEPYHKSTIEGHHQAHPDPVIVDGEKEYKIEHVIRSEIRKPKKGKKWWVNYLVKWKDYPPGESTWENVDAFADGAMHFLRQFHLDHPDAPMDLSFAARIWRKLLTGTRTTIGTQMMSMLTLRRFTSFLYIHLFISLRLHNTLILWRLELRTWNQVLRPVPLSLFIPALYLALGVPSFIFYLPSITPLDFKGS